MGVSRGGLLVEVLVALVLFSMFLSFEAKATPPQPGLHREESAVVFLGVLLGELRISQETLGMQQVRPHEHLLVVSQGGRTLHRKELDSGVSLMLPEGGGLRFQTGVNFNYSVNDQFGRSGLIYVSREGGVECRIMMNFGTFVMDLR